MKGYSTSVLLSITLLSSCSMKERRGQIERERQERVESVRRENIKEHSHPGVIWTSAHECLIPPGQRLVSMAVTSAKDPQLMGPSGPRSNFYRYYVLRTRHADEQPETYKVYIEETNTGLIIDYGTCKEQ